MASANLQYAGNASGGPNTIAALVAGSTNDIVIRLTSTNTIWYTNGVIAKSNAPNSVDDFFFGQIGTSFLGSYKGSLLEVGLWTNFLISATEAATLHTYATNTYHYGP